MKIIGRSDIKGKQEIKIAEGINVHYAEIMVEALKDKLGAVNFRESYYPVMVHDGYELKKPLS